MASIFEPSNAGAYDSKLIQSPGKERNYFENIGIRQQTNEIWAKTGQAVSAYTNDFAERAAKTAEITNSAEADLEKEKVVFEFERTTKGMDPNEVAKVMQTQIADIDKKWHIDGTPSAIQSNNKYLNHLSTAFTKVFHANSENAIVALTNQAVANLKIAQNENDIKGITNTLNASIPSVALNPAHAVLSQKKATASAIMEYTKYIGELEADDPNKKQLLETFIKNKEVLKRLLPEDMKDDFNKAVKAGMAEVNGQNALQTLSAEAMDDEAVKNGTKSVTDVLQEKYSNMLETTKRFNLTLEGYNTLGVYINNAERMEEKASVSMGEKLSAEMSLLESRLALTDKAIQTAKMKIANPSIRAGWETKWNMQLLQQKKYKNQEEKDRLRLYSEQQLENAIYLNMDKKALLQTDLKKLYESGEINKKGLQWLYTMQQEASPANSEMVKGVLKDINATYGRFTDIQKKGGVTDAAAMKSEQIKYYGIVMDYCTNHMADKDFDTNFPKFIEEQVYRPVIKKSFSNLYGAYGVDKPTELQRKEAEARKVAGSKTTPTKIDTKVKTVMIDGKPYNDGDIITKDGKKFRVKAN